MSGLLSKTCPVTIFKVNELSAIEIGKLRQFAFQSIDELKTETKSVGWTNFDDMLDTSWATSGPEYGEWLCFSLRMDTRTISAAVMKKKMSEACKEELEKLQAEGKTRLGKGRKKELKAQIMLKLLPQIQPSPTVVNLSLNTTTGLLYVGSVSATMLDTLSEHCKTSFGIDLEELNLGGLEKRAEDLQDSYATESFLSGIYSHSVDVALDGHSFTVAEAGEVTLGQKDGRSVTTKNEPESVAAGLQAGLYFQKLKMIIVRDDHGDQWDVTMNREFRLPALKCPATTSTTEDSISDKTSADREATVLERLHLISQGVAVLHKAFQAQWA